MQQKITNFRICIDGFSEKEYKEIILFLEKMEYFIHNNKLEVEDRWFDNYRYVETELIKKVVIK